MPAASFGHLAMLFFSVLVAGSFALGGLTANHIDPRALTALRFIIAAVVISVAAMTLHPVKRRYFDAPWRYLLMGAAMGFYFVMMFEGLKTAPPVSTAAVFTLTPFMSAGFGWLLMRQTMTPRIVVALLIGAAGALWVIFRADLAAFLALDVGRGELVFLVGCVAHAFYTPLIARLNRGEPTLVFTAGMLVGGAVLTTAFGWPAMLATDWANLPPIVWITLGYLALISTAFTFFLVQFAAMRLPASKVMAYTYLTPSVVILWEGALGHGWPPLVTYVGIVLTIGALLMLLRSDASRPQPVHE